MSKEEKPGFTVTTNDASETIIINDTQPAAPAPAPKPAAKGVTNADTP